jgi:hypothetical protein
MTDRTNKKAAVEKQEPRVTVCFRPSKIVSGGQTGVDRGALDAAIKLGIPHGGWCPANRMAEDGTIPGQYQLQDNGVAAYPARTRQNVADSDATLILHSGVIGGGTRLTQRMCKQASKPFLMLSVSDKIFDTRVREWLDKFRPSVLNVAGSRESSSPGIQQQTASQLIRCLATKNS